MRLKHKVAFHKKNSDGSVLVSFTPVAGTSEKKKLLVYKNYVDDTLAQFLKGDGAGIYFGAEVSDKYETVIIRYIGYFEHHVFQDMYTPCKDFRFLFRDRCIVGKIE